MLNELATKIYIEFGNITFAELQEQADVLQNFTAINLFDYNDLAELEYACNLIQWESTKKERS